MSEKINKDYITISADIRDVESHVNSLPAADQAEISDWIAKNAASIADDIDEAALKMFMSMQNKTM